MFAECWPDDLFANPAADLLAAAIAVKDRVADLRRLGGLAGELDHDAVRPPPAVVRMWATTCRRTSWIALSHHRIRERRRGRQDLLRVPFQVIAVAAVDPASAERVAGPLFRLGRLAGGPVAGVIFLDRQTPGGPRFLRPPRSVFRRRFHVRQQVADRAPRELQAPLQFGPRARGLAGCGRPRPARTLRPARPRGPDRPPRTDRTAVPVQALPP